MSKKDAQRLNLASCLQPKYKLSKGATKPEIVANKPKCKVVHIKNNPFLPAFPLRFLNFIILIRVIIKRASN